MFSKELKRRIYIIKENMQHRNILLASPHENTIELIIAVLSHQQFYIPIPSVQEGLISTA